MFYQDYYSKTYHQSGSFVSYILKYIDLFKFGLSYGQKKANDA